MNNSIKPTILCVDDEEAIRTMLKRFLETISLEPLIACDGQEAFEAFINHQPDIVLTDIRMPRMDGLTLTKRILMNHPRTYVVIITGHGTEQTAIEALQAGAVNYLKKPFSLKDLRAVLDKIFSQIRRAKSERVDISLIDQCYLQLRIPSRFEYLPSVLRATHKIVADHFRDDVWHQIRLGIDEIVTNSIEHGNLGIGWEEKQQHIENETYNQLLKERQEDPHYGNREVTIEYLLDKEGFTCTITDEGDGFDWRALPDPRDPSNLLKNHGRGILLTQLNFDQLAFNERGNQVRLYKKLPNELGAKKNVG